MRIVTKARQDAESDMEAEMAIMGEELAKYPPDVVRSTCREYARREKFFPALSDLVWGCEGRLEYRRNIWRALNRYRQARQST